MTSKRISSQIAAVQRRLEMSNHAIYKYAQQGGAKPIDSLQQWRERLKELPAEANGTQAISVSVEADSSVDSLG